MTALRNNKWRLLLSVVSFVLFSSFGVTGQGTPAGIRAEMDSQKALSLSFSVTSAAQNRVTFYRYLLPWENVNSIILVAVTAKGETLLRDLPIDDPSPRKVSLDPGESVSGSIDLRRAFRGLDRVLSRGDVNLFWAYNAPKELGLGERAGGWILLHQQR